VKNLNSGRIETILALVVLGAVIALFAKFYSPETENVPAPTEVSAPTAAEVEAPTSASESLDG